MKGSPAWNTSTFFNLCPPPPYFLVNTCGDIKRRGPGLISLLVFIPTPRVTSDAVQQGRRADLAKEACPKCFNTSAVRDWWLMSVVRWLTGLKDTRGCWIGRVVWFEPSKDLDIFTMIVLESTHPTPKYKMDTELIWWETRTKYWLRLCNNFLKPVSMSTSWRHAISFVSNNIEHSFRG